tara:strand:+ start:328 stop:474 length:147 start_codon:yes stop_codon:yes gene_type:complete
MGLLDHTKEEKGREKGSEERHGVRVKIQYRIYSDAFICDSIIKRVLAK